jgi:hypothetical protein
VTTEDPRHDRTDEEDIAATHGSDRPPTAEEEAAAERTELSEDAARHYQEAIERGADIKGEGEVK